MKLKICLTVLSLGAIQAQAAVICLNFAEADNNAVFNAGDPAGPLNTDGAYWNSSSTATGFANGTINGLKDDTGAITGVNATWSSSNVWYTMEGNTPGEKTLSCGYLDDGGSGYLITVTNIPYATYKVYGLVASDQNEGAAPYTLGIRNAYVNGSLVFGGTEATSLMGYGTSQNTFNATGSYWTEVTATQAGNYWTFDTSGGTLTIDGLARDGENRGTITGLIIQDTSSVPEPSSAALLIGAAGFLACCTRRRRV